MSPWATPFLTSLYTFSTWCPVLVSMGCPDSQCRPMGPSCQLVWMSRCLWVYEGSCQARPLTWFISKTGKLSSRFIKSGGYGGVQSLRKQQINSLTKGAQVAQKEDAPWLLG